MFEVFQFEFMRNALAAGILASVVCGLIGTFVVVNRIVFISGGIAHAAYGGIGLAFFLGLSPLLGILGFSLAVALVMAGVNLRARERADTVIGVLWAVGMAMGVILIDLTPGYNVDLMSYLFGSILVVPRSDLYLMVALTGVIFLAIGYFYRDFVALSYDEEFARIRGVPVARLYVLLMVMIALTVVLIIRVVGLILVIALLTIAPYITERYARSTRPDDRFFDRVEHHFHPGRPGLGLPLQPDLGRGHHPGGGGRIFSLLRPGTAAGPVGPAEGAGA